MHVPVLIVGGGPIGLTASLLLSHFGVESLLVNKRATTSTHPRARFVDVRTIEILRQVGLDDAVIATGVPAEWVESVRYSETFDRPEVFRLPTASYHSVPRVTSPTVPVMTAQDLVEPIMYGAAQRHDAADVRFGTELIAIDQDDERVTATFRDVETGEDQTVTADYVIAADGRKSAVRSLLGGDLVEGYTNLAEIQDVLFHADMSRWVGDRIGALLFVNHPMGYGLFQPMDGHMRWRAQCTTFTPPIPAEEVTVDDCVAWIRSAIGDHDGELELEVQSIAPWHVDARLSDTFRRGRVFLAGDAAHMLSPTGGYGMNLGYHGIHNLAWKLAFVLQGHVRPEVLDTYETERRPQADRTRIASVENAMLAGELYATHFRGDDLGDVTHRLRQYGNFEGMILGVEYESTLCRAEPEPGPAVDDQLVDFVPCVRAGRRAPHVWLDEPAGRSVLDLFGSGYVVLAPGPTDPGLRAEVDALAAAGFPISVETIPVSDLYPAGHDVVVRPDGVVAARLAPDSGVELAGLLGR